MQFRKKYVPLLFVFVWLCALTPAQAQGVVRTNEKGEKIIVFPDGGWRYFNQEGGGINYPTVQTEIGGLDNPVLLTEEDAYRIATRRAQLAREASAIAQNRAEQAQLQRQRVESELQKTPIAQQEQETVRRMRLRLNAARTTEIEAMREAELALQELAFAEGLTAKGNILQEFKKTMVNRASQIALPKVENLVQTYAPAFATANPGYYFDWNNNQTLASKSPATSCAFTFNGMDEASGRWRRDLRKELLFTYTDERLRLFLKEKEYLRCEAYMSSANGFRFLTLEFTFAYPNAREAYGFIEKGSILTLKLLNGQIVNLASGAMDRGSYDTRRELLTYRVQYPIDQSVLGLLAASELESVRVFWSSGFEEYPVFALDFFMKQLRCLDSAR